METLKNRVWVENELLLTAATNMFDKNKAIAAERSNNLLIVAFTPPSNSPFYNSLGSSRIHVWNINNTLYFEAKFNEMDETIRVDFGQYFDFPIETIFPIEPSLEDGDNHYLPNWPEDILDVLEREPDANGTPQQPNFRYRCYRSKEVHYLYNLNFISTEELETDLKFLVDPWTRWDRNQVVLWAAHERKAERCYIDPIRRLMLAKAGQVVPFRLMELRVGTQRIVNEAPVCAEYIAWLHQPILRAMHRERLAITARAHNGFRSLMDRESEDVIARADLDLDAVNSWKPEFIADGEPYHQLVRDALITRTEASLWSFHNVIKSEWRAHLLKLQEPVNQVDVEDEDEPGDDDFEYRIFPSPSEWAYHWSNMQTRGEMLNLKKHILYLRVLLNTDEGQDIPNVVTDVSTYAKLKKDFFGQDALGLGKPWEKVNDVLSQVIDSGLMVGGQIGGLQTFIGTRVHFRLSIVFSGGVIDPDGNHYQGIVNSRVFVPAIDARPVPPVPEGPAPNVQHAFARNIPEIGEPDRVYVQKNISNFMRGEAEADLGARMYTRVLEHERDNGYLNFKTLVNQTLGNEAEGQGDAGDDNNDDDVEQAPQDRRVLAEEARALRHGRDNGETADQRRAAAAVLAAERASERAAEREVARAARAAAAALNSETFNASHFSITGVEVPLYNPFCMYEGKWSRYQFLTTQADFTALAMDDRNGETKVILGEFKTLIERNQPYDRVTANLALKQTITNALLFKMQTGIEVDLIMQVFVSRRQSPAACYMSCASLQKLRAGASGEIMQRIQKSVTTNLKLLRFNDRKGFMHFDGKRLCVFRNGYPVEGAEHENDISDLLPNLKASTIFTQNPDGEELVNQENAIWFNGEDRFLLDNECSPWSEWRDGERDIVKVGQELKANIFVALIKDPEPEQDEPPGGGDQEPNARAARAAARQEARAAAAAAAAAAAGVGRGRGGPGPGVGRGQDGPGRDGAGPGVGRGAGGAAAGVGRGRGGPAPAVGRGQDGRGRGGPAPLDGRGRGGPVPAVGRGQDGRGGGGPALLGGRGRGGPAPAVGRGQGGRGRGVAVPGVGRGAGRAGAGVPPPLGAGTTFRRPPEGFEKSERDYPADEPNGNKQERLELRDKVMLAMGEVLDTPNIAGLYAQIVQNIDIRGFRRWRERLKRLDAFSEIRPVHMAAQQNVNSGDRMTLQLMHGEPDDGMFTLAPENVLKQLVIRALHRYVDDFVFKSIDMLSNGYFVANTSDGFDKRTMSRQFIHNSQRAYWKISVLRWARVGVVHQARDVIIVALSR